MLPIGILCSSKHSERKEMKKRISNDNFDIHEKLKGNNSHWSYLKPATHHYGESNYELCTMLIGETEHALYERQGTYFVLIDFFNGYKDACQKAKTIIDKYPDLKCTLSH